jgi:hypothetical protein
MPRSPHTVTAPFASHTDEDGTLIFEGRLPAEQGALLLQALDRAMEWLFRGQPHRERMRYDDARIEDTRKTFAVPMRSRSWPSSSWRSRPKQRKDSARPTDINSWCTLPRKRCRSTNRRRRAARYRAQDPSDSAVDASHAESAATAAADFQGA